MVNYIISKKEWEKEEEYIKDKLAKWINMELNKELVEFIIAIVAFTKGRFHLDVSMDMEGLYFQMDNTSLDLSI
jgi:hypothetical protein